MKFIKLILRSFFLLTVLAGVVRAQDPFSVYEAAGDTAANHGNFYGAHISYKLALEIKENADVAWKAAEVCRKYQNYPKAENFYRIVLANDSVKYPQAYYWYAEMLKYQGKYKVAAGAFKEYYRIHKLEKDYLTKKAKLEQKICATSVLEVDSLKDVRISRMNDNINTDNAELSSYVFKDSTMYFSSVRPTPGDSNIYFSKIYQCNKVEKEWGAPIELSKVINEPLAHVNNLNFSRDGKTAYFCKCRLADNFICNIYQAEYYRGAFSNVKKLPDNINMPGFTSTTPHLAVLPKGEVLFFASDRMPGGKGGTDIWYARKNADGSFTKPVNCGTGINTPGGEYCPFYDARDSALFFSSEWHTSLGGYDIFKSKGNIDGMKWNKAKNAGRPINSSYNDMYFSYGKDSVTAYFTSNRPESHKFIDQAFGNDIYTYEMVQKAIDKIKELVPLTLYFENDMPNPKSQDTVTVEVYERLVKDFLATKDEYLKQNSKHVDDEVEKYNKRIIETLFNENINKGWVDLYLFAQLLEVILRDGQDIVITFKGYTSPLGNTQYNENLAKRRISCVQNFFDTFDDQAFAQYLKNEPKTKKGSLKYRQVAIGETVAENTFKINGQTSNQDDLESRKNISKSVYSPAAALQRKIEILAIEIDKEKAQEEEIKREIETTKKVDDEAVDKDDIEE